MLKCNCRPVLSGQSKDPMLMSFSSSKSKPKTAPAVASAKTKEGNSLFSDKEEEVKDVSSAKGKTEHPAAVTKVRAWK